MGINGLEWQALQLPFAAGLNQRGDARAQDPPYLDICTDVQFNGVGASQTRKPYALLGNNILGGGTVANPRKLVAHGNELLLFTSDTLYTWSVGRSVWIPRGTHLAVSVDEATRFASNGDQITADRAEMSGTVFYTWVDAGGAWIAATDKVSGSVIQAPTVVAAGVGAKRTKLVVLSSVVHWYFVASTATADLEMIAIDPANVATSIAAGIAAPHIIITAASGFDQVFDATRISGADSAILICRRNPATSYSVIKVTAAGAVTASTKARAAAAAMAIACDPIAGDAACIYLHAGFVTVDLITVSTLADHITNLAIGAPSAAGLFQVGAVFRSTQIGGFYRCEVFWSGSSLSGTAPDRYVANAWADTGNNTGGNGIIVAACELASKPFEYNGAIYCWSTFGQFSILPNTPGAIESSYFLHDSLGRLHAKATPGNASTLSNTSGTAAVSSHLPSVALTSGSAVFAWCAMYARAAQSSSTFGYAARAPREITVTFDSNEARRTARLGPTLYIATGEGVKAYDGIQIAEVGYHVAPWITQFNDNAVGALSAGVYAYKPTYRWVNANGESDRSTSFTTWQLTLAAGRNSTTVTPIWSVCTWLTHKPNITIETWRTAVNPLADSPFYLVSSNDPNATTNPNRYESNSLTTLTTGSAFIDNLADAVATTKEINPDNGSVLENIAPPPAKLIVATDDRIFLAGIAGQPDTVWYSKTRTDGLVASFNDALTIVVPTAGGLITGLGFLDGTLIVFRERAIYAFAGDGYDNLGQGTNYGPVRIISTDTGATNQESIALSEDGLTFKSAKGWHVVDRSWQSNYIGGPVTNYDSETVLAAHVLTSQHQIRCLSASRMLVYDYVVNQWSEWTINDGLHAALSNGVYYYLSTSGPKVEQSTWTGVTYGMDIETVWVKPSQLQGYARIRAIELLGEYRTGHTIRIRVARNYESDGAGNWNYYDDVTWNPTPTVAGSTLQVRHGPSRQQCQAIKVRITITPTTAQEACTLTGIAFEVGIKRGINKSLYPGQKA